MRRDAARKNTTLSALDLGEMIGMEGDLQDKNGSGDFATKFGLLRNRYRRPDGDVWKGTELERSTGGLVSSAYVTAVKNGAIKDPGLKYLKAIAQVMGFPSGYWLMDVEDLRELLDKDSAGPQSVAIQEQKSDDEAIRVVEAIELLHDSLTSSEIMIVHRTGGFNAAQKALIQSIVDSLK